jgi:putative transposase
VFQNTADEPLVDILAYALMPNHFHLVAKERSEGGISRFMLKLMTAYSMFFNTKYERSGPLFTRPFRSKHVDSDAYLRWVFAYVSLNPLDLIAPDWGERGVSDIPAAHEFMQQYRFSSFPDYINERPETRILAKNELPLDIPHQVDELLEEFAKGREFSLSTSA